MFYEFKHFGLSEYFCKEFGKDFSFPMHLHQSYEFITILSGEMDITVDGAMYNLKKGESMLIFPHQIHSLSSTQSEHMLCIFSPEIVKAYYTKTSKKLPTTNKFILDKNIIDSIISLSEDSSKLMKKGILYTVCAKFDDCTQYTEKNTDSQNLLYTIFAFIENNYTKDCTLEDLSKETSYSYAYLSRYFKNTVGMSFNNYVNQYRILNACYNLSNTADTILQCSLDCGYESLRSFNRNFKSIVGVSPKKFRETYLDTNTQKG